MAFSLLGGVTSGSSQSTAAQTANVNFVPTVNDQSQPLVSSYPAGQGLATLNAAYPGSAAFGAPSLLGTTGTSSLSATSLLLLAAVGVAAWLLLRGKV